LQGPRPPVNRVGSMNDDALSEIQRLLDRLRNGDDSARNELVLCALPKLRGLAARILTGSFPDRPGQDTSDVRQEVVCRLLEALRTYKPSDVTHFLRMAAQQIRWFLIDEVRKNGKTVPLDGKAIPLPSRPPDSDTPESIKFASLHQAVEQLP